MSLAPTLDQNHFFEVSWTTKQFECSDLQMETVDKEYIFQNQITIVLSIDMMVFILSGATDEKGHEVSKSLHGDAIVFYMIRCEAFECLERLYQQYPEMQYSISCHEHHQHGSNMLSSEEILVDIEAFNVNHFLDWSPHTVGV